MSIVISMSNSGAKLVNADQQAIAIVSDALSYDEEGAKFTAAYKMGTWNGKKTFLKFPGLLFQAGFVPMVRQALAEAGYAITIHDQRERVEITADDIAIEGLEPYDFQLEAVSVLEREVRGIVMAATGAGKTEVAIMATKRFGLPTLFLTHKLDLVRQTRNRYQQRLGRPVGMISEGEWLPADITVATIQTILANWTKIWEIRGLDRSGKPAVGEARGPTEPEAAKYAKTTLKWKRVDSVKHIAHGKILEDLFEKAGAKALWLSGSDDGDSRELGLSMLKRGEINILIASTILDEGLDCDAISGIVLAGGEKSKISLFQRVGRSVRAKKGDILERLGNTSKVVDFIDTGDPRLMKHSATRYKAVKDEEGWVIDGIKRWADLFRAVAAE
jgi:superfamily II DNA or RNA helicase